MSQLGIKYEGSSQEEVSGANQEIVPTRTFYYKFSFMNSEDCSVKINNSEPIFIKAGLGFSMNEVDAYISSFVIVEEGINYTWIGGSR